MPVSVKLPNEFQGIYSKIFKSNPEEGTMQLVIHELRRRLAEYRLMEKKFLDKYNGLSAHLIWLLIVFIPADIESRIFGINTLRYL